MIKHLRKTVLKIVCAFCKKEMGEKDSQGQEGVTSSICEECWVKHFPGVPYPREVEKSKGTKVGDEAQT